MKSKEDIIHWFFENNQVRSTIVNENIVEYVAECETYHNIMLLIKKYDLNDIKLIILNELKEIKNTQNTNTFIDNYNSGIRKVYNNFILFLEDEQ